MANFTKKYRDLVLPELQRFMDDAEPIRLMFSPGTDVYFWVTSIANQKGLTTREVVTVACRLMFISLIGYENEPNNTTE